MSFSEGSMATDETVKICHVLFEAGFSLRFFCKDKPNRKSIVAIFGVPLYIVTHTCTHIYIYIVIYIQHKIYTYIYIYTYTYIYIYIHMHLYRPHIRTVASVVISEAWAFQVLTGEHKVISYARDGVGRARRSERTPRARRSWQWISA